MDFVKFVQDLARQAQGFFRGKRQEKMISPVPEESPTPTPDPFIQKGWEKTGENSYKWPDRTTPTPTPRPDSSLFDFAPYRESGEFEIQQPPQALGPAIRDAFGDDADKAAVIAGTENPSYDPQATNVNRDGSVDIGIFQINSNTLKDFQRRKPRRLQEAGINSLEDLKDPIKNIKAAKIIYDEQGPGAWYGPKNKGYNVQGGE